LYLAGVRNFIAFLTVLSLVSCRSENPFPASIFSLREMNDLTTVEYTVTKIVRASDDQTWYKIGDRKILMSCKATLRAGVDLSRLSTEDVKGGRGEITITLPRAHLIYVNLRPEDVKVEYEDVGLLRSEFSAAERDAIMARGEQQIKAGVPETGILNTAESNAGVFVGNFLRQLGYQKVKIVFADGATTPALK
jgi:hypothetical protein